MLVTAAFFFEKQPPDKNSHTAPPSLCLLRIELNRLYTPAIRAIQRVSACNVMCVVGIGKVRSRRGKPRADTDVRRFGREIKKEALRVVFYRFGGGATAPDLYTDDVNRLEFFYGEIGCANCADF